MKHIPVLLNEVISIFDPKPGQKFIDATLGMAGHANEFLKASANVLGVDTDPSVILRYSARLAEDASRGREGSRNDNLQVVAGNFSELKRVADENGFDQVDGILFDLGLGSHQLDAGERGFSFQKEGPLDMRFSQQQQRTAGQIVNFYPEKELIRIFQKFGEEKRFGKRIARGILAARKEHEIETTTQLFEIIKKTLPGQLRFKAGDSARRIFQGLRIEVNSELNNLEKGLQQALQLLKAGGKLVVISFHSLEDRIVKSFFIKESKDCVCPPQFPECRCDARARVRILTKKPVTATPSEIETNSRSKSAKLRAAERI